MKPSPRVIALLDSMWGSEKERRAPRWFRINPFNTSGRRLYKLVGGDVELLVTNCCPMMQVSARHHGKPDPAYVADNLRRLSPFTLLLVCGQVAQRTYYAAGTDVHAVVMMLKHPAARTWTKEELNTTRRKIDVLIQSSRRQPGVAVRH